MVVVVVVMLLLLVMDVTVEVRLMRLVVAVGHHQHSAADGLHFLNLWRRQNDQQQPERRVFLFSVSILFPS